MPIPVWMLLGFAAWTLILLFSTVGVYRWTRILSGSVSLREFRADQVEGEDWYKRAMRAHANCLENLPIFGAIVLALYVSETSGPTVDALSIAILVARVLQSLTHVSFVQTDRVVMIRFAFFFTQIVCFFWLIGIILWG